MDEAVVAERGGFRTRAELMHEAVENLLNELDYPEAPALGPGAPPESDAPAPPERQARDADRPGDLPELPDWEREELALTTLADTALRPPAGELWTARPGDASAPVRDEPLLGLHNRDYVSLWALHRLARYTAEGPIEFEEYLARVTRAAWHFGSRLRSLEREGDGQKLTVLFPTNFDKRPSAERGFQSFAIGSIVRRNDAVVSSAGPLFAWRAIRVAPEGTPSSGLTPAGCELLRDLDGISLDLPHPPDAARRFLAHLARHAPADRWGFDHLLRTGGEGPDREGLVGSFAAAHPEWTAATASSVAQGYVARAREWGLLEPRLVEGRYWLTETGREVAEEIDAD